MAQRDRYLVPAGYGEAVLVEKRSRFVARIWHVGDEKTAQDRIGETRDLCRDAAHNVFAYVLRNGPTRYGDDGEPQGTAGLPTLNVLVHGGFFNACCVVTRYFGGVLLGAGGLARAYSTAAKMALDAAGTCEMRLWSVLLIPCPYSLLERTKNLLAACGGVAANSDFGVEVVIEAYTPAERTEEFVRGLLDASSGLVRAEVMDTVFRGV